MVYRPVSQPRPSLSLKRHPSPLQRVMTTLYVHPSIPIRPLAIPPTEGFPGYRRDGLPEIQRPEWPPTVAGQTEGLERGDDQRDRTGQAGFPVPVHAGRIA